MRATTQRVLAVAMVLLAILGADIASAGEVGETIRLPFDLDARPEGSDITVVAKGDHLWKISKRHLAGRLQRTPSNTEVGPYWREVIEENVGHLRSGDPDLIYPGEVIQLPETRLSAQP